MNGFLILLITAAILSLSCGPPAGFLGRQNPANTKQPGITLREASRSDRVSLKRFQFLNQNLWLAANDRHIFRSEDKGRTWLITYTAPEPNQGSRIRGLQFLDSELGFMVVDRLLFRTRDSGLTWTEVGAIGSESESEKIIIDCCYFLDAQNGWAAGAIWGEGWVNNADISPYTGAVWATNDGGLTWRQQRLNLPKGYLEKGMKWSINDVFFRDSKEGWIAGDGVIFWTQDGGTTWNLSDGEFDTYKHIEFLGEGFGWATNTLWRNLLITVDGGRRWKKIKSPPEFGGRFLRVLFLTPEHGFATLAGLYETRDGGRSWVKLFGEEASGETNYEYLGRALDGTLIALIESENYSNCVFSEDNGATWKPCY